MDPDRHLATLEHIEAELGDVEHALRRLDDGTYRVCEACGGPISQTRQQQRPVTRLCRDDHAAGEPSPPG